MMEYYCLSVAQGPYKKEHISLATEISLNFTIFSYEASDVEMLYFGSSNSK